ncbi:MAG: hypothetical protein FJZ92_05145 [Chloroflexi bacterium]|nr:hypothetical protein [Chloroflexota bacterium]
MITEGIREITPRGVDTRDGRAHAVDAIIHGTGFQASRFLTPMRVAGRSIISFSECEVQYVRGCLRLLLAGAGRAMHPRAEAHDAYNERIDAENRRMVWGVATVNSWYRNEKGRSAQNWPGSLFEYWAQTREVNAADYVFV